MEPLSRGPLGQDGCQGMAGTGKYLGPGVPVAHQPLLQLLLALKTVADPRRAVLVERAPKKHFKASVGNHTPSSTHAAPETALGACRAAAVQLAPASWEEHGAEGQELVRVSPGEPRWSSAQHCSPARSAAGTSPEHRLRQLTTGAKCLAQVQDFPFLHCTLWFLSCLATFCCH